jgi:hypothetical protein
MAASAMACASFAGVRGPTGATVPLTIVLLAPGEGLHSDRGDQPDGEAEPWRLAAPVMRRVAGLHRDDAIRELRQELGELRPDQFQAK